MTEHEQQTLEWAISKLREAQESGICGSVTVHLHEGRICKVDRHESQRAPQESP